MTVSVTWHGHATLSLDVNGQKVVVDPFFSGNPAAKVSADTIEADYILLTHGHGDHVADAVSLAKRTGALVISNFEIANWMAAQGHENVHGQHIGGGYHHPIGYIKLTIAFHGSSFPDGSYGGMPCGFLLNIDDKHIYIAGDTALYSDMALYGRHGLDLAIIPIGDNFTMGPEDALQAVKYLKPKTVIPYHYNTWPPISQDVNAWAAQVRSETESDVVVMEVEGTHTLA
ncbi:MAG: metal-dependent hydrolase [Candidatus Promineifilaceae bacterium]